jgi:GNAT superfamily N-acetyltransferase
MSDGETPDIGAPEHLNATHDLSAFDSGVAALDDWLKRRALANEDSGASRSYVVSAGGRVIGYYALATGAVTLQAATGRIRRNMPDPIPVMVPGRLAIDKAYQAKGLGRALLRDAILRTLQAAAIGGIRAILVHAVSEDAKRFYERYGFASSPLDPMTLMITVADAEKAVSGRIGHTSPRHSR